MALAKGLQAVAKVAEALEEEQFKIDPRDFFSARERAGSVGTQIAQLTATLADAAQILNSSIPQQKEDGEQGNNE